MRSAKLNTRRFVVYVDKVLKTPSLMEIAAATADAGGLVVQNHGDGGRPGTNRQERHDRRRRSGLRGDRSSHRA